MSKTIQLRNVPDDLHRVLKSRAALAGKSLSGYLIAEIRRHAEYPDRGRAAPTPPGSNPGAPDGAAGPNDAGRTGAGVSVVNASAVLELLLGTTGAFSNTRLLDKEKT